MLTTNELSGMRAAINQLLPDTAQILTVTNTPDGFGGQTETYGTATSSCRLDMRQGHEQVAGGGLQPFTEYVLSLPYDTAIAAGNRVVVGGTTYNVTSVNTGQSWSLVKRVTLEAT